MKHSLKELEDKLEKYLNSKFEDGVGVRCGFLDSKPIIKVWASHFNGNKEVEIFVHVDNVHYLKIRKALLSLLS